jgi:hypothetical protein
MPPLFGKWGGGAIYAKPGVELSLVIDLRQETASLLPEERVS